MLRGSITMSIFTTPTYAKDAKMVVRIITAEALRPARAPWAPKDEKPIAALVVVVDEAEAVLALSTMSEGVVPSETIMSRTPPTKLPMLTCERGPTLGLERRGSI